MERTLEIIPGRLYVPYYNWYGKTASRFFQVLRDERRFLGTRCPLCNRVYNPPRGVCPDCFKEMDDWVELPPRGTLLAYTVVNYTFSTYYQPRQSPYILGIVKLDGADTGMCHLINEVLPEEVSIGMKVEAVFAGERRGDMLDIAYFRPCSF